VGRDAGKILNAVDAILAGKWKRGRIPQLWDGHAAGRIISILLREVLRPANKEKEEVPLGIM
jgi:UDP-N-acetylglucosamine 2-epimerase (non-hydrolysing)